MAADYRRVLLRSIGVLAIGAAAALARTDLGDKVLYSTVHVDARRPAMQHALGGVELLTLTAGTLGLGYAGLLRTIYGRRED